MKDKPDRICVEKDYLKDFKLLQEERDSPFYKKENKDVFMMAMILGVKNGVRVPLKNREGFFRIEYLNNEERTLIKSIAISSQDDLFILTDQNKIFQIAEEYASGGIKYLKESVFSKQYGTYIKKLESELIEESEKW